MHIEMNGMWFHLRLHRNDQAQAFTIEIVDEAFAFGVARGQVDDLDSAAAFVRNYTGMAPRTDVLSQVAERLHALGGSGGRDRAATRPMHEQVDSQVDSQVRYA